MQNHSSTRWAFIALLGGASGIGFAPVLVRLSEVGPSATAFYRLLFALPLLWGWMELERRGEQPSRQPAGKLDYLMFGASGLFFTADLAVWHWSLQFTTVANSTLLANFAPLFVTLGAWIFLSERITRVVIAGMLLALAGATLLVGASLDLSARHLLGDALAVVAAVFYAGYLLMVKILRRSFSTATIMVWSGFVSCPALLCVAALSGEKLLATAAAGWLVLIALALVSHVGGQSLIAYGLGHLPASFSSVSLLWQPVMAALLAWAILKEPLGLVQGLGAAIVLAGIALASGSLNSLVRPSLKRVDAD